MKNFQWCIQTVVTTTTICMLSISSAMAYPEPVAVITNYGQVADQIKVNRANGECEDSDAILYPGDQIHGIVTEIAFEFSPYANYIVNNGEYVITYSPPSHFERLADNFLEIWGECWDNIENIRMGVSRGPAMGVFIYPQPGNNSTVFSDSPVRFQWETAKYKIFIIKDDKGNEVFRKDIEHLLAVDLIPHDVGLQANYKYTWILDKNYVGNQFSVLGQTDENILKKSMETLQTQNLSEETKHIKQAAYLQFMSDTYPQKFDLYWQSYILLLNIDVKQEVNIRLRDILLLKCRQHVGLVSN